MGGLLNEDFRSLDRRDRSRDDGWILLNENIVDLANVSREN